MAASFTSLNSQFHVRSVSLPTRLHPHSTKIEAELNKLRAWEKSLTPTVPLNAETVRIGLVGLAELYNCVEELIHSQHPQQPLLQYQHDQILVEEALEESVKLLDACSSVKDLYLTMKERLQDLQSALRRNGGVISIERNINAYMCCKKKAKQQTMKCLTSLKQIGNKTISSSSRLLGTDHCLSRVIRVLREVTSVTVSVLRSLLLFLSAPSSKTKAVNGWSLISKLMLAKPAASSEIFNEEGSVDGALRYLRACIRRDVDAKVDVKMVSLRRLQTLDATIEGLEAGLDCLFRRLIQNRVFLLNILA